MNIDNHNKAKILIVDDEPLNIKSLVRILEQSGFQIYSATNGHDALIELEENDIDLILLDVMMPVLNGFQLSQKIKSIEKLKEIPIIFLTGCIDTEDKVKGLETGALDYITKPFVTQEVLIRVKNYISLKKAQDQIREYNKNLEKILKERTRKLIQTERQAAVSLSIQGILHNLKNPLTGIIGGTEIISEIIKDYKNQNESLEACNETILKIARNKSIIEKSSEKLMNIINTILIKGRKDRNAEFEIIDLNELIKQEQQYIEADNNYHLDVAIKTEFSPEQLLCNVIPVEIAQVLHNLVKNSIDALREECESPIIQIKTGKDKNNVWFQVSDNGPGIPKEIESHIFEPFYSSKQLEDSKTSNTKGSGLGLYSCWELATSNKGNIQLMAAEKSGADFRVEFPREIIK